MRRLIPVALVAWGCTRPSSDPPYPDLSGEIAACVALSAEGDRLACYEDIARDLGLLAALPPEPPPPSMGNWIVNEDRNPLDDSRTVSIVLFATSGTGTYGRTATPSP
jgi:type VI secretion system protein VasI